MNETKVLRAGTTRSAQWNVPQMLDLLLVQLEVPNKWKWGKEN